MMDFYVHFDQLICEYDRLWLFPFKFIASTAPLPPTWKRRHLLIKFSFCNISSMLFLNRKILYLFITFSHFTTPSCVEIIYKSSHKRKKRLKPRCLWCNAHHHINDSMIKPKARSSIIHKRGDKLERMVGCHLSKFLDFCDNTHSLGNRKENFFFDWCNVMFN